MGAEQGHVAALREHHVVARAGTGGMHDGVPDLARDHAAVRRLETFRTFDADTQCLECSAWDPAVFAARVNHGVGNFAYVTTAKVAFDADRDAKDSHRR